MRTLEGLKKQTLSHDLWELLLLDNASEQDLSEIFHISWHPSARCLRENELGLTPCRLRGIQETSGDLIVFVDDDNILDPNYLEVALRIITEHPQLACIGAGIISPEFEEEPKKELLPYLGMLALRDIPRSVWANEVGDYNFPWGAGLVVSRKIALIHKDYLLNTSFFKIFGRNGNVLNSGEDDDFSWTACKNGMGIGVFRELRILHLINSKRVQTDYLLRLREGHVFSKSLLRWKHLNQMQDRIQPISLSRLITFIITGQISAFLNFSRLYWMNRKKDCLKIEMDKAYARGVNRAIDFITNIN